MVLLDKLKWIVIEGKHYLGQLKIEDGKITVFNASEGSSSNANSVISNWLECQNLDELKTFELSAATSYVIEEVDKKDMKMFTCRAEDMTEAKRVAIKQLENHTFRGNF